MYHMCHVCPRDGVTMHIIHEKQSQQNASQDAVDKMTLEKQSS